MMPARPYGAGSRTEMRESAERDGERWLMDQMKEHASARGGRRKKHADWATSRRERIAYYLGLGGSRLM